MSTSYLDIQRIRSQFPSLSPPGKKPPVFFDNPGGTQVPQSVIEAVSGYYLTRNANVGGAFETSRKTTDMITSARSAMAALLGAADPNTIVFGANMTSLTFHLARSIGDTIAPGDEIVVTDLDHDANVAPWADLRAAGAVIKTAPINRGDCTLSVDSVAGLLSNRTRVLAVTCASNAVGTIPDVQQLVRLAHEAGALAYVDAVQFAPHRLVDVEQLDCDFLACSAYKFFGPHAGILYGKREWLERLSPHKVRPAPDSIPHCWETGTQNHEGIAGIEAAVQYIASIVDGSGSGTDTGAATLRRRIAGSMKAIEAHEAALGREMIAGLNAIDGIRIYGIVDPDRMEERLCTVAFTWDRFTPDEISARLGDAGVYCWSGNYYALRLMESLGLEGTGGAVRIGPAHYNTIEEIRLLIDTLRSW